MRLEGDTEVQDVTIRLRGRVEGVAMLRLNPAMGNSERNVIRLRSRKEGSRSGSRGRKNVGRRRHGIHVGNM